MKYITQFLHQISLVASIFKKFRIQKLNYFHCEKMLMFSGYQGNVAFLWLSNMTNRLATFYQHNLSRWMSNYVDIILGYISVEILRIFYHMMNFCGYAHLLNLPYKIPQKEIEISCLQRHISINFSVIATKFCLLNGYL